MTKKLFEIIEESEVRIWKGDPNVDISSLHLDSREVRPGGLFIALKGHTSDGHQYIDQAIAKGCTAVVCMEMPVNLSSGVVYMEVIDSRSTAAKIARRYHDDPSAKLKLIGVTGTNGKTTVATLSYQLFEALGYDVGLISTVENKIKGESITATHTTPHVLEVNRLLAQMVKAGCSHVFMEVSSHAVDQGRIEGLRFAAAIFTNISHDHLDYHLTFKNYINAKKKFFDVLDKRAVAIVNKDDKNGLVMVQNTEAIVKTYALQTVADYKGKIINNDINGLHLTINDIEAHFRMIGAFNAYNLLSVYAMAVELGIEFMEVLIQLSKLKGAEGRFEQVVVADYKAIGIVDYAHTPDALENVLRTIKATKAEGARTITVVGCGGDRDRSKRPEMARVSARMSDLVILTSDNPRTESPDKILDDMEAGLEPQELKDSLRIVDRKQAIRTAVRLAEPKDVILIAGKGHEKYQDINGVKTPFDDKQILRQAMLDNI